MTLNEEKRIAFEAALSQGKTRVVFDMTLPGVVLPEKARVNSADGRHLALDYSRQFHMPDFKVTDEFLQATLSFGNRPSMTRIPWEAVRALLQGNVALESWPVTPVSVLSKERVRQAVSPTGDLEEDPDLAKWITKNVAEG